MNTNPISHQVPDELLSILNHYYPLVAVDIGTDITPDTVTRITPPIKSKSQYKIQLIEFVNGCILRNFEVYNQIPNPI